MSAAVTATRAAGKCSNHIDLDRLAREVMRTSVSWNGITWYPGIELFGEGIFIDLGDTALTLS